MLASHVVQSHPGLKIDLKKSKMIPIGLVDNMEELASEISCEIRELPTSYLGLPLEASYKSKAAWDGVEERFCKRLSLWKREYISKEGRLMLLCSIISSLPIYFMPSFTIPRIVRLRLEKIQRDFLWEGGSLKNKLHLMKWWTICKAKSKGGLGV